MNVQDFTYLLQNPNKVISVDQTKQLEDILSEYPYFQAARAVHLKGLKNLNSFKYNDALKVTAAYTTDRNILFDFITSRAFLQNTVADTISHKNTSHVEAETSLEEIRPSEKNDGPLIKKSGDAPLPQTISDTENILDPELLKSKEEKAKKTLELGQPLAFTKEEKYSFGEWLQLTSHKTIERKADEAPSKNIKELETIDFPLEEAILKKKKFELIDKFIANNPKIAPKENPSKVKTKKATKFDNKELMTETLAKVYLEQKKYKNTIQAYKILSLKYPEKSGFFADRIKAVEKIQKENT
ncbi:FIG00651938: hypothetical protein [hydrothermal vent metagenome]|uniref:Tetratricopeptide repeat protein n=1 Tax=hydrothermal vent metagenome TaxID=652676 RepID=A0A3B0T9U3_9ZZZZ